MKKMLKVVICFCFLATLFPVYTVKADDSWPDFAPEIQAEVALVLDYNTKQLLLEKNINEPQEIASMTKMITQYIVLKELKDGNLTWDDQVTVSSYPAALSTQPEIANVPLIEGNQYSVSELFHAMSIESANAATVALAEHIEGSEPAFVDRMRALLDSWGIDSSQIYNASGLNNRNLMGHHYPESDSEAENKLTGHEVAEIAYRLITDYPMVLEITSISKKTFQPETNEEFMMVNWNKMLEGLSHERPGVTGLKTGTTREAGANFAGVTNEGGSPLITVVMHSGDGFINKVQRFEETNRMMDYAFDGWESQEILKKGQQIEQFSELPVQGGAQAQVPVEVAGTVTAVLPKDISLENLDVEIDIRQEIMGDDQSSLQAPLSANTNVGTLRVDLSEYVRHMENDTSKVIEVPLVTSNAVSKQNIFEIIATWLKDFLG